MPVVAEPTLSPEAYFAQISSLHLLVVKASDEIAAREGDSGLGQTARRLADDHRGIAAQLSLTGRRLNLLPSAALLPKHATMLAELQASGQPPIVYVRQMKSLLPRAYAIHQRFADGGSSPTLRPIAVMAAPVIAGDYQLIKDYSPAGSEGEVQPQADILDAGVLAAEQSRVAHVHDAGLDAYSAVDLRADSQFGFEQNAATKSDPIGAIKIAGGASVDSKPDARTNVDLPSELGADPGRCITGVASTIHRAEEVRLKARTVDSMEAIAHRQIRALFASAAQVQRGIDRMLVHANEQLAGVGGSRNQACCGEKQSG
jgi:hypothetical protein